MSVTINRTAQRYSSGAQAAPRMVLLHTTEGMGWPGYGGGSSAPHATVRPIPGKGIEVREHIPFGQFAKALQNRPGGVQTNTSGVLQFELMGTCDERTASRAYYWPRADDTVLAALADYLRPIMRQYGIPATSDVTWKSYNRGQAPSSYGLSNGVRMSFAKWNTFRGICGHQHSPENDHGDPGDFPIATLLRHLSGAITGSTPTPEGELSMSDVKKILDRLDSLEKRIDAVPAKVADYRVPLSNADRSALGGSSLKSISVGGLLKTGVRLQARQSTAEAVLKEVQES